jgi:hypothetical protein
MVVVLECNGHGVWESISGVCCVRLCGISRPNAEDRNEKSTCIVESERLLQSFVL